MRLKLAFLTLIFIIPLAACQQLPAPTPTEPAIEPSITGLTVPELYQTTADAVRQNMALFLKSNPYTEYEAGNQLPVYGERARNAELWDVEGRRYIDFAGGIAVLNTGHRHPKVIAAVQAQLERFTTASPRRRSCGCSTTYRA